MLQLHDCIYCGQPVIVNTKLNLVYSIQCDHDNNAMFYIPGAGDFGVPTGAVAAAIPHPTWPTATDEVVEEEAPIPVNTIDFW